jgi:hypothetical protein
MTKFLSFENSENVFKKQNLRTEINEKKNESLWHQLK